MKIKKAVIPIAGLGTRFLPLSKVVAKEFFPLVDKPVLQYIIEEFLVVGIKDIILVNQPDKKKVLDYFKKDKELIKILKKRGRKNLIKELEVIERISKNISFSQATQKKPLGDGHAVLQAKNLIGKEPFAAAWADDVVESKIPCIAQLIKVFQKYKKPVLALARVPKESFPSYGMIEGKRIGKRTYKIKKIIEKPKINQSPSNLAIVGRYVLTPEILNFLEKAKPNKKGEIILDEVLAEKTAQGQELYGYEFEGKWLECGNKLAYLKSNIYLSLKHPKYSKALKKLR